MSKLKQIPNLFTLLNLAAGFIAIILCLQTGETILNQEDGEWRIFLPERIWWASVCLFIAAIVDFLDGFVARLFKATSEMGKQLDSLADVVSFGVVPGLILYQLLRISFAQEPSGLDTSIVWLLPALLVPLAAAWRLARFNIDTTEREGFEGMPTPAAGLFIASFPFLTLYNPFGIQSLLLNHWVLYAICLIVSWLMVSRIPLLNLKFKNFRFAENKARYSILIIAIISIPLLGWLSVPVIFFSYILVSLLLKTK
jgi:CDP-diacylglycerol--serine O-phosphatidyltransferase